MSGFAVFVAGWFVVSIVTAFFMVVFRPMRGRATRS